ncbi:MAG: endonuclease/exonuclease/phosphatase family protein [Chloroflexi bacterium]|nr:endonuclease/exonuclease/phosphatase family protein [Chloroflexota bacterium]MDA1219828.1 endonuclease/exonuclease/phosphatase family protein [Chloroflexota bacterium]PKB57192.1 MAG: endonuclease [SAR202 cluster bacterium Casp-Chloro-G3]
MPSIMDQPPGYVTDELRELRAALAANVPAKILDHNLLIATWNIRAFGDLTEKWASEARDNPKRDLHALVCIAEIISRFDVIAIQEVKSSIKALRHMLKYLGPNWGLILTDVTKGSPGNDERLAFLYDTRKVQLSGLACELVVPKEQLDRGVIAADALDRQFARTPYAVSFKSGGKTFVLVTLHVLYGSSAQHRVPELKALADWLGEWARNINAWQHNFIALGDFNIDRHGDDLYDAFTSSGLYIPEDMNQAPRSIFAKPGAHETSKFYDQIAWFNGDNGLPALSMQYARGGSFDFVPTALKSLNLTKNQLSWRISDHFPLWTEFILRD